MSITEEKEPTPEPYTLVLSVPSGRIGELRALATYKTMIAQANADDYESRKQLVEAEYWRKEEVFWANIREQLNQ
jgi:hypothetical protein